MKLLIPWTIAFICGCLAYLACGGRLLVERCPTGPICPGDFCCPSGYGCADGGCAPAVVRDAGDPPSDEPWVVQGPPVSGGAAGAGMTPRAQ